MPNIVVTPLAIPDVRLIDCPRILDERGFFSETYNTETFRNAGILQTFLQDNHSVSDAVGTVRGLHFQMPPFAQDKLVRVTKGRILDIAVDIRKSSPTFGHHVAVEISAEKWNQVLVPAGFAHGFVTLEPDTQVLYKVSSFYSRAHDYGIHWSDPDLSIRWPVSEDAAIVSQRDRSFPRLADAPNLFP